MYSKENVIISYNNRITKFVLCLLLNDIPKNFSLYNAYIIRIYHVHKRRARKHN